MESELYEYLIRNTEALNEKWQKLHEEKSDDSRERGSEERKQYNRTFIENMAKIFINDKVNFSAWSEQVAVRRANGDTPLRDTLESFKYFRNIFWTVIMEFVNENEEQISLQTLGEWSAKVNASFDHVIELFTVYYQQISDARLLSQQQMILELSAPVIPVFSGIGVLPLVGEIDTYRAQMIKESSLHKCTELQLEHLIIDLSGVPIMDTMVANELFQVVRSLSLLGVETTVTGIRPEIAQTAVNLGLDFSNISTYAHLSQALPVIISGYQPS
ncbi:STAS domain-containing protein [Fictibacillus sp. NRS-1165]|uniref:STAS domain-containing protein n=1 Tax=Fictibacillus sp. NRS-1165 TaxID=3144463 RepID=UPI003D20A15C